MHVSLTRADDSDGQQTSNEPMVLTFPIRTHALGTEELAEQYQTEAENLFYALVDRIPGYTLEYLGSLIAYRMENLGFPKREDSGTVFPSDILGAQRAVLAVHRNEDLSFVSPKR